MIDVLPHRPKLLLADDHKLVLEGFERILTTEFDILGMVEDGRALVSAAEALQPDAILLDISMPLLNGIDAARQLRKCCPRAKLLFVSMHTDIAFVLRAFRAGARGYLLKQSSPAELIGAVRSVLQGQVYVAPELAIDAKDLLVKPQLARAAGNGLTPRQREVLQLIAEGRSNKDIAAVLNLSVKAVEFHKSRIAQTIGTTNSAALTQYAVEHGLIEP
jgi:DNA-binding NarL/FixJ family response regulator